MGFRSADWGGHTITSNPLSWSHSGPSCSCVEGHCPAGRGHWRAFSCNTWLILEVHHPKCWQKVSIHPPINLGCISRPFPEHAAPDHQRTSSKLDCPLHKPITQPLSWHFSHPFLPIWPQTIYFGLIWPYNPFTVFHCPIFECRCKVHPHPPMLQGHFCFVTAFIPMPWVLFLLFSQRRMCWSCLARFWQHWWHFQPSKKWWGRQHTGYQQVKASVDDHQETWKVMNNV